MEVLAARVDHVHHPLGTHPDVPLQVHARYSRIEILAAFGIRGEAKVAPWQTGVYWAKDARADLLAFTLDKTSGGFSPTTRYRDHAVSRELIHWESQSSTRADREEAARQKHARVARNGCQRRSQIVRNGAQKVGTELFVFREHRRLFAVGEV